MPSTSVLDRTIELPAAAEAGLHDVLVREMDRFTPFTADAVLWDGRVIGRAAAAGCITVRLLVVPRLVADALVRAAAVSGWQPSALLVAGRDGTVRRIRLAARRPMRPWVKAAALAAILAGPAAAVAAVVQQSFALSAVETEVAVLAPRLREVAALRRQIDAMGAEAGLIDAELAGRGDALQALGAVTAALPDDTVLTSWTIHGRVLGFNGQSGRAVDLVEGLSAVPGLSEVHFTEPTIRLPPPRGERFALQARWTAAATAAPLDPALLERPPFAPDRRPAPAGSLGAPGAGPETVPVLTGIVLADADRLAIFAGPPGGQGRAVREGGSIGAFTVGRIGSDAVVLDGADGRRLVKLRFASAAGTAPALSVLPAVPLLLPPELQPATRFAAPVGPYGMPMYRFSPGAPPPLAARTR